MKFNININQKALSEYDIDIKDACIFDYIQVMCSTVNSKVEENRLDGHTWINYERLIEDMPMLDIKSRNSVTPRIKNLEKAGLISVKRKMINGHRRVFVKMTTLSESVFVGTTERVRETVQDNYTNNNYTKATKVAEDKNVQELLKVFYHFDKLTNKTVFQNKTERKAAETLLTEATPKQWEGKLKTLSTVYQQPYFPSNLVSYKPTEVLRNLTKIRTWINKNNKQKK